MLKRGGASRVGITVVLAAAAVTVGVAPANAAVGPCPADDITVTADNIVSAEESLFCLVNSYRDQEGRSTLEPDPSLANAARVHSREMAARDYFSHDSPTGLDPFERAAAAGYPADAGLGENLAFAQPATPRTLFDAWQKSEEHDATMLDRSWLTSGIGLGVTRKGGAFATQLFGDARPGESTAPGPESPNCTKALATRDRAREAIIKQRQRVAAAGTPEAKQRARTRLKKLLSRLRTAAARVNLACGV